MTQAEQLFLTRLGALSDDDPLLVGLKRLMESTLNDTVMASSRPAQTADDRAYNDGRQSMAMDLIQALSDARHAAQRLVGGESDKA